MREAGGEGKGCQSIRDREGKDRGGKDRAGRHRGGKDRGGKDRAGRDRGGKDKGGKDRAGRDRGGKDRAGRDGEEGDTDPGYACRAHRASIARGPRAPGRLRDRGRAGARTPPAAASRHMGVTAGPAPGPATTRTP
eukprot:352891-Chlamydomonas_euryale.AAC.1